ncbi:hypothetical protein C7N43_11430 [Sphingobacteriales bacterium UPWRP_1]|nr:hypothetical protein C7N43_11430 [Sphingobacteriales bacterium UPWRP_1]
MKNVSLVAFMLLFLLQTTYQNAAAQNYNAAVGLNLGVPVGITYKQFLNDRFALEVIGGFYGDLGGAYAKGFEGIVLAQWHAEIFTPELNFIYGAGGHLGSYDGGLSLGGDVVFGLEYTFGNAPISFSFCAKPAFGWLDNSFGFLPGGSFGLRYIISQ